MATKKKSARPAKAAKKSVAKKSIAKKSIAKKSAAKKPVAKKSGAKKTAKRPVVSKKSAPKKKVSKSKVAAKSSASVEAAKIVIPPVPSRGTTSISTTPTPVSKTSTSSTPTKKSSSRVLFLVIAGVVLLAIFAISNSSMDDGASPKPAPAESVSDEPSNETEEGTDTEEETESESAGDLTYEAPTGFVAINNGSGVTLRWKAPMATEGLTGYLVSISYNAIDFKEVATVPVGSLSLDVARVGDEGGTQFFIQSVYSDGTKADGAKFALKGKYE